MSYYNLFLDDLRNPKDAYIQNIPEKKSLICKIFPLELVSGIARGNWDIVRSYQEFVEIIEQKGIPNAVSFDHDLTEECMQLYIRDTQISGYIEYQNIPKRTGWHCAKYLIEKCKEINVGFPKYYIHSANIWGAANIEQLIKDSYDK